MSKYTQFCFRAPSVEVFLQDVRDVCVENGINPFRDGVIDSTNGGGYQVLFGIEKDPDGVGLLRKHDDGTLSVHKNVDAIPAGRWHETNPTHNADGTLDTAGTLGDYALFNVLTKDEDLIALAEQFKKTDPSLSPSEVPTDEKIGGGTHRIDGSMVSSPVRTW